MLRPAQEQHQHGDVQGSENDMALRQAHKTHDTDGKTNLGREGADMCPHTRTLELYIPGREEISIGAACCVADVFTSVGGWCGLRVSSVDASGGRPDPADAPSVCVLRSFTRSRFHGLATLVIATTVQAFPPRGCVGQPFLVMNLLGTRRPTRTVSGPAASLLWLGFAGFMRTTTRVVYRSDCRQGQAADRYSARAS